MKSIVKDAFPELILSALLLTLFIDGIGFGIGLQLLDKESYSIERYIIFFILSVIMLIPYCFEWSFQSRIQNKPPKGATSFLVRLFKKDKSS